MSDISTLWDVPAGRGDYAIANGVLKSGTDLETAVLISLFTDRLADSDDKIPDGSADPRGWACDDAENRIGSRLWLLDRTKQTNTVLNAARDYCNEALKWLLTDAVAATIDVKTSFPRPGMLGIEIVIAQPSGDIQAFRYGYVWKQF